MQHSTASFPANTQAWAAPHGFASFTKMHENENKNNQTNIISYAYSLRRGTPLYKVWPPWPVLRVCDLYSPAHVGSPARPLSHTHFARELTFAQALHRGNYLLHTHFARRPPPCTRCSCTPRAYALCTTAAPCTRTLPTHTCFTRGPPLANDGCRPPSSALYKDTPSHPRSCTRSSPPLPAGGPAP